MKKFLLLLSMVLFLTGCGAGGRISSFLHPDPNEVYRNTPNLKVSKVKKVNKPAIAMGNPIHIPPIMESPEAFKGPESTQESEVNPSDQIQEAEMNPAAQIQESYQMDSEYEEMKGRWISVDDQRSTIEIGDGVINFYYSDQKKGHEAFTIQSNGEMASMMINTRGEISEYSILELTDSSLVLSYLPRGNTLRYRR